MTQSDPQAACGTKLRYIFDDGGGNWSSLKDCRPAVRTWGKRDVSQDNTTKHKFWNANLHVIMQDPVAMIEVQNTATRHPLHRQPWLRRTQILSKSAQSALILKYSVVSYHLYARILPFDSSCCRLSIYSHTTLL